VGEDREKVLLIFGPCFCRKLVSSGVSARVVCINNRSRVFPNDIH